MVSFPTKKNPPQIAWVLEHHSTVASKSLGWATSLTVRCVRCCCFSTLPETNIAPENQWLEDELSSGTNYFQGLLLGLYMVFIVWHQNRKAVRQGEDVFLNYSIVIYSIYSTFSDAKYSMRSWSTSQKW